MHVQVCVMFLHMHTYKSLMLIWVQQEINNKTSLSIDRAWQSTLAEVLISSSISQMSHYIVEHLSTSVDCGELRP